MFALMNLPTSEHPFLWIARKSHKTHFATSKNRSCSLPKLTNTPLLYDGTTEAKLIVTNAQVVVLTSNGVSTTATGILLHVLEYLKGRDVPQMGMWTLEATGYVDDCQICHGEEGGEQGNENLINGVRVCDYCHARMLSGLIDEPTWDGNGPTPYISVLEKKPELIQIMPKEAEDVAEQQSNPRHFPEGD